MNTDVIQRFRFGAIIQAINVLKQVFLDLAFSIILFVFGLLYFFHQVTFPITMQERPVAIFTKLGSNVILV